MLSYYANAYRDQNKIAITFDDGPNPSFTPKILEILNARKIRATFFIIGRLVEAEPTLASEVYAAGHVIGNHTYSHPDARKVSGVQFWKDELERTDAAIQKIIGQPTSFFRIPYLAFAPDVNTALEAWLGNRYVLAANVVAFDWEHSKEKPLSSETIQKNILQSPQLGPGAILLFHDGSENTDERRWRPEPMVAALPIIIDKLIGQGYELVGADELDFDTSDAVLVM